MIEYEIRVHKPFDDLGLRFLEENWQTICEGPLVIPPAYEADSFTLVTEARRDFLSQLQSSLTMWRQIVDDAR